MVHLSMVICQGIGPTPKGPLSRFRNDEHARLYEESKGKGETFFEHLFRDGVVALVLFVGLVWMASAWPVPTEQVADPTDTQYVPRPEWYFYFLFELLWKFRGEWMRRSDTQNRGRKTMVKDPVCGMQVDEKKPAGSATHGGRTYYFCSPGCKASFEKAPDKYATN